LNPRPFSIPYRQAAQSLLYLSAGMLALLALILLVALLGWDIGREALLVLVPSIGTSLAAWSLFFLMGLLTLGLTGFALTHPWLPENRPDSVLIHSEKGDVRIPLTAIEDYLQREAIRIPGVNHLRLRLENLDGLLVFFIQAFVTDQVSVPGITGELQGFIEHESLEVIGLKRIGPVHVMIKGISNDTRPVTLPMLAHHTNREVERRSRSNIS
jgi:hypothetical protein